VKYRIFIFVTVYFTLNLCFGKENDPTNNDTNAFVQYDSSSRIIPNPNYAIDPSDPISRIDLLNDFYMDWQEFKDDRFYNIVQLNAGKSFYIPGAKLNFFLRIPLVTTDLSFETVTGLGDVSFDVQYSTVKFKAFNKLAGVKFIFPTESYKETGAGKYIAAPFIGGIGYFKNNFAGLTVADYFSFAGKKDRSDIHELSLNPYVKFDLGKNWYTLITPDIRYNFKSEKFFIPYSQEFGKIFSRQMMTSVKGGFHLLNSDKRYDWNAQVRFSYLVNFVN
jgi:hypothetical protein